MGNNLAKMKAYVEAQGNKGGDFEKFDYENRRLKTPAVGETRVRILENIDLDKLFFYEDFHHKIDDSTYIDCKGAKSGCKVCQVQDADLWDEKDELKKAAYRQIKRIRRNTIQVALLDADGMVDSKYPKLFTPAKTLMALLMDLAIKGDFDPSDDGAPIDLLIVKEKDDRFFTYKNSKYIPANPKCDLSKMEDKIALTTDKYYNDKKAIPALKKYIRMFDLEIDTSKWGKEEEVVATATDKTEDLDEFEKQLQKEIEDM